MKKAILFLLIEILFGCVFCADCVTLSSGCLSNIRQIHRLGLFRGKMSNPTEFVYTITQYNTSKCIDEQYSLKYIEVLSCVNDPLIPFDLSCIATIQSIYVNVASIEEMNKYGYYCSQIDLHTDVEISQTTCRTNSKMGFGSIKKQVGLTHSYQINQLENDSYQIGNVIFKLDDHNLCYKSYTNEILIGVGGFVGLVILISVLVFIHRKKQKSLVRRLSTSNRKDLGGFDNAEAENTAAF